VIENQNNQSSKLPGLLLVAHGSRITSSNEEIVRLSTRLADRLQSGQYSNSKLTSVENQRTDHCSRPSINLISSDIRSPEAKPDNVVVEHAFLELTEPSIPQGIDKCASRGVARLYVLPYFLAAGRHVREDIPEAVKQGRDRHPQMTITVLSHIGQSESMLDLIIAMASDQESSVQDVLENAT